MLLIVLFLVIISSSRKGEKQKVDQPELMKKYFMVTVCINNNMECYD